jgi:hypothetical protein
MNYVYLESKYNEFYLNDEAYAQIVAIVRANKCCMYDSRNRHPYKKDNPCVGRNICVEHLLQKQRNLTRLDVVGTNADRSMYYFVDTQGYVYTSIEDSSDEARKDVLETLSFYGFTPPKTVESRGKMVDFYSHYATLHGDLRNASVIVMSYQHLQEKVKALFLLYKGGQAVALQKRGDHKSLYTKAEELVEATKDATNKYYISGASHYGRYESDIYEVISQLESAMYDVTRKFHNGTTQQPKGEQQEVSM